MKPQNHFCTLQCSIFLFIFFPLLTRSICDILLFVLKFPIAGASRCGQVQCFPDEIASVLPFTAFSLIYFEEGEGEEKIAFLAGNLVAS